MRSRISSSPDRRRVRSSTIARTSTGRNRACASRTRCSRSVWFVPTPTKRQSDCCRARDCSDAGFEDALRELAENPAPLSFEQIFSGYPRYVVGAPDKVRDQLTLMAEELRVQELMVVTIVHDHRARMHSYELLAQAFGLTPR